MIGSNQYFQTILSSTLYVWIFKDFYFSPGSVVLFSSSIFTILLIYIKEGVHQTRTLIYGIILSNVTLTLLSYITSLQIKAEGTLNLLNIPKEIFEIDIRIFLIGTFTLLLDSFLIIIIYEFLLFKIKKIKIFWVIFIAIFTILYFDLLVFSTLSFWGKEGFKNILIGNIIGKSIAGTLFSLILYFYIVYIDKRNYIRKIEINKNINDVFSIITYREQYEFIKEEKEHIEELKNSLIKSNENKDRFFSIISHDLRSPFHAILGFLNLMKSNFDSMSRENIKTDLDLIQKSFNNSFDLLNNLLDWSRIQMDRIQFNPVYFSINELISICINSLKFNSESKDITVLFNPPQEFHVFADKNMINSVINNLLSNAIKFTNTGGKIIVELANSDKHTIIKIQDNGVGIEKEVINRLFRVDKVYSSSGTNNEKGTGLGLILSDEFIKINGGSIDVESEPGKGSTFTFSLPQFIQDQGIH